MPLTKIWQAKIRDNRKQAAELRQIAQSVSLRTDKEALLLQSNQLERQADELEQYIAAS
jgi:uncharacterized protein YacL (UPF0231 family)